MSVVLSEHLPLLASAPDGIQKLRGLILELAVRGKLVPQDPNDEPATVLLKRIATERARLEAEGKVKSLKRLPPVGADEQPFALPDGWEWSRLGLVTNISTGRLDANAATQNGEYPFFTCSRTPSRIDRYSYDTDAVLLAGNGDFNIKSYSGKFDAYQRTYVIEPIGITLPYLYRAISQNIGELTKNNRGSAIPYLKIGDLTDPAFPVPPLAEQHRIVAKVDELMALCDRLEAEVGAGETAHAKLVETLLGTLTQSTDAAELTANWQRLVQHFDTLFTTDSSLDALKQTILQLAVMGKLVPQDPKDEPATELLKRIARERARLEADGKIKASKPLSPIVVDEQPFPAPDGWVWTRWGNITHWMTYGFTRPMPHVASGPTIITAKNVLNGAINFQNVHFTTEEAFAALSAKDLPSAGDILITKDGSIGRAAVVPVGAPTFCINQSVAVLWLQNIPADRHFLVNTIHSELLQTRIWDAAEGAAIKHISITDFVQFPLPLPPLAEQHRIVANVDELMALCDRLKTDLGDSRTRQARLSATLIESALQAA